MPKGKGDVMPHAAVMQQRPIGYIPPAEAEEAFYANLNTLDMVA